MTRWSNWSGRQSADVDLRFIRTADEAAAAVAQANDRGQRVRVAGAGHSHSRLVPSDDVILDLSALSGVISADSGTGRARIRAGTPIYALGPMLHAHGLALPNQGDIDRQSIGGATSTGTHGSGLTLTNLSALVVDMTIVLADGEIVTFADRDLSAARLNLGAFGVVTELELQLMPSYRLEATGSIQSFAEIRADIDRHTEANRHFEFFWASRSDQAAVKIMNVTDEEPVYPLGDEHDQRGWSFEVLPSYRPDLHTETEFSIPLDRGPACLDAIHELFIRDFPTLPWPIEYRTIAGDDVWMSTAFGGPVATISVHQGIDRDDEPLFRAVDEIFRQFDGRPHWGKVHYFDGADLSAVHPRWDDWWAARDAADPNGTFLNDHLRAIAPRSRSL